MSSNPPPDAAARRRVSFLPTTLTGRLVLTSITLVAAVSVVVAVVTTLALRSFLLERLDDQLHEASSRAEGTLPDDLAVPPDQVCLFQQQRPYSKAQILDRVWNYDFGGQANVVGLYISYLRKKIDANRPPMIHTMRGAGYVLRPAV